eukprot:436358-Prorocentrum_minimum.AAC.1
MDVAEILYLMVGLVAVAMCFLRQKEGVVCCPGGPATLADVKPLRHRRIRLSPPKEDLWALKEVPELSGLSRVRFSPRIFASAACPCRAPVGPRFRACGHSVPTGCSGDGEDARIGRTETVRLSPTKRRGGPIFESAEGGTGVAFGAKGAETVWNPRVSNSQREDPRLVH